MPLIGENLRIKERTCIDYWYQNLGNNLSSAIPAKDPPDSISYSTTKYHPSKILITLGIMAAYTKADDFLNIDLSG